MKLMMDSRNQKAAETFVMNLTGADDTGIQGYFAEIRLNQNFHNRMEENRSASGRRQNSSWDFSIGTMPGMVLYTICRSQKPDIVVETGVASGVSSSYILCAMEQNQQGQLYSIDLPWRKESQSGWIVPDYLRDGWHLIIGDTSDKLEPLLKKVGEIDIFLHDSDHSYQNMIWEFQTAWKYLKKGGLLLSHNIDTNHAFPDFCREHGIKGYSLTNMGGLLKT